VHSHAYIYIYPFLSLQSCKVIKFLQVCSSYNFDTVLYSDDYEVGILAPTIVIPINIIIPMIQCTDIYDKICVLFFLITDFFIMANSLIPFRMYLRVFVFSYFYTVTWLLEQCPLHGNDSINKWAIVRQWPMTTREELLEAVFSTWSMLRLYSESRQGNCVSCSYDLVETVASQKWHKQESRRTSTVGNCYLAMPSKDIEDFTCAAVCRSMKLLQLPVVTSYKCSINPIINPNPKSSH
jgi:hypothetical protein